MTSRLDSGELRNLYTEHLKRFKSDTHNKQFFAFFEPIKHDYENMALWLFSDERYKEWENTEMSTTTLLYIKGARGFGKTVKMTCITKKLTELTRRNGTGTVLYFFFKQGDDATQLTAKCLESLLYQLLDHRTIWENDETMKKCLKIIEEVRESGIVSGKTGGGMAEMLLGGQQQKTSIIYTNEAIAHFLAKTAALLGFPVYIVVDAIDECDDRVSGNLIATLKQIAQSAGNVKIIMSVRDNVDIEKLLQDAPPVKAINRDEVKEVETEEQSVILPGYITCILIDEENNKEDMRFYLTKKLAPVISRRVSGNNNKAYERELQRIVKKVQTKAGGNFSYAAMVVANLHQPSRASLDTRLNEMPSAMEGMYRKSLETLSPEERKLIVFALKWIVWGVGEITASEIVEHYKQVYEPDAPGEPEESPAPVSKEDVGSEENEATEDADDPEISDTIYHLRSAGRDFFKFDDLTGTIDVHLSVREWVKAESRAFEGSTAKQSVPIFTKDGDGNWSVSFPIPPTVSQSEEGLAELFNKREAHLAIAIDIFRALNSKVFQDRYMPWDPPPNWVDFWEEMRVELAEKNQQLKEKTAASLETKTKEMEQQTPPTPTERVETPTDVPESQEGNVTSPGDSGEGLEQNLVNPSQVHTPEPEPEPDEISAPPPTIKTPTIVNTDTITNNNNTELPAEEKNIAQGDLAPDQADPEPEANDQNSHVEDNKNYFLTANSDLDTEDQGTSRVSDISKEGKEEKGRTKKERYELLHWLEHLGFLQAEWKPEEMNSSAWGTLYNLIDQFFRPATWRRWIVKFEEIEDRGRLRGYESDSFCLPLHTLATSGPVFLVEHLIQEGRVSPAEVDFENGNGATPLALAVSSLESRIVGAIIKHGAQVNAIINDTCTPILLVLLVGMVRMDESDIRDAVAECAVELINAGADLEIRGRDIVEGYTTLHAATLVGPKLVKLVLEKAPQLVGVVEEQTQRTEIHIVTEEGRNDDITAETVKLLLEHGSDVNAQNEKSEGPLRGAVYNRFSETVKILIASGADVHDDDEFGETEYHTIASPGPENLSPDGKLAELVIANSLLEAGLDFERKAKNGLTPLSKAVKSRNEQMVRWFIDAYLKRYNGSRQFLLEEDLHGRNLLYRSCTHSEANISITKMVLEGLSTDEIQQCLDQRDKDHGYTALHVAAHYGNLTLVDFLLSLGTECASIKDLSGRVALDIAGARLEREKTQNQNQKPGKQRNYKECFLKLLPATHTDAINRLLHLKNALRCGSHEAVLGIAQLGADPEATDEDGWSAFHFAHYYGSQAILKDCFPDYPHETVYNSLPPCKTPTRLSSTRKGEDVILSDDFLGCSSTTGKSNMVLTDHPIPATQERYYFEMTTHAISMPEEGERYVAIGLQTEATDEYKPAHVGWANGVGYHGDIERIYIFKGTSNVLYRSTHGPIERFFGQGDEDDTVGCGVDMRKGIVWFTLNGEYLGKAADIDTSFKYYPAVSFRSECSLKVNLGGSPFLFQQPFEDFEVLDAQP
ncbi:Ankyrin-1 [Dactylella cylindrospora]|nr:Ankyrin-1 [Dactylella cylindrospora]